MSISYIIIGITCLISFSSFNNNKALNRLIFNPYSIQELKQYYRFITSGFIHADFGHLLFNMLVLFFFGNTVEQYYAAFLGKSAPILFGVLYIGALIFSSLPTFWRYKEMPHYNSLGASGATVAVLFTFIFFDPWATLQLYFFLPIPAIIFGILYLVYSGMKMGIISDRLLPEGLRYRIQTPDNINHEAHFYGALWGVLFTFLLKPQLGLFFINRLLEPIL